MGILFKGGTVINADGKHRVDVLVEGETIAQIGADLSPDGHQVIDCAGKLVMPGGIDVHTHLDLPFGGTYSNDDFSTGHRAAAFGGTTSHIDFVIQPKGGSLHDGLATWRKKAEKAQIDYAFHMAITDLRPEVLEEIPSMVDEGITSLKLFMAYKNVFQIDDTTLFRAMKVAAKHGMIVMVHAENGDVEAELTPALLAAGKTDPIYHSHSRPPEIEGEATNRAVMMSGLTGCSLYVVHMTCQSAVEALSRGRALGYPVMGETCIQYFFLTAEEHLGAPGFEGAKFVCSPPIRTKHDQEVLWHAINRGPLSIVSTDHCDFWYEGGVGPYEEWAANHPNGDWHEYEAQDPTYRRPGKERGKGNFAKIPNGLPAIEDRMMVLWHAGVNGGRMTAERFVEVSCTNPAKVFGMYPRKGAIVVGADADIAVWDPDKEHTISAKTHHMVCDYNLFEGMTVRGVPVQVFVRGKQVVDGDQWLGHNGYGKFIPRKPFAPII
ncbi:MAG: dihydropyrimidinase [Anaerolineae bacterium]|nr:dihydropyrimidinase [Anaerolineae bacterium]MDW8171119.1 dihydropyrimidinase [Anaerolineae bacterium]